MDYVAKSYLQTTYNYFTLFDMAHKEWFGMNEILHMNMG